MKRAYYGAEEKKLIDRHERTRDSIHVLNTDGYGYNIAFKDEADAIRIENELDAVMLSQAEARRSGTALDYIKKTQKKYLIFLATETAFLLGLGLSLLSPTLAKMSRYLLSGAVLLAISDIFNIVQFFQTVNDVRDFKKYDIYLDIRDDIKKYSNVPYLFEATGFSKLGINDVDKCSLREMKIISRNLEAIKEYSKYTEGEKDEKGQVEKSL